MTTSVESLQPLGPAVRSGPGATYVPATPSTVLWGRLPCEHDTPVLSVDPGTSVWFDTVSHEGILDDQGRDPVAFFTDRGVRAQDVLDDAVRVASEVPRHDEDGPHVVTGPVRVRGAQPGDVLTMTVEVLRLRAGYGVVSNRHGRGALPEEFPLPGAGPTVSILATVDREPGPWDEGVGSMPVAEADPRRVRFPLRPFLGIMGVATAGDVRAHSVPPGDHGGNLDVSLLGVGSTLHVPVQAEGALAYVGDPHYAQGDGEVALTAFEAPLRARVRLDVLPPARASMPRTLWAETSDLLVPIGIDADLDEAMRIATRSAVTLLINAGMDPAHAYAYLSAAGDFAISQVVDQVTGVHGKIRKADLVELLTEGP
ncbi:acetamidase [Cellulomonas bogoriensis 69B4 = DSM 16987]|uniref:Acetamidase n=1 Tax=Cellulomonas bogoriensis 69B4 = DSM 16987 TaxID=1386082 RepID=A0A0A0BXD9_9CELL|nr:acetamidase [Cellulomonas bogoriensis 69B4 = DSM 16987]